MTNAPAQQQLPKPVPPMVTTVIRQNGERIIIVEKKQEPMRLKGFEI